MSRLGFSPGTDPTEPGDIEEDVGEDAVVTRSVSLRAIPTFRAPPPSERASVVNPIFAGSGSRMKRTQAGGGGGSGGGGSGRSGSGGSGGGGSGGGGSARGWGNDWRTSLASIDTDMCSGELDLDTQGTGASARYANASPAAAAPPPRSGSRADRRGDWSSGGIPTHSGWAGYGGGGAAAWVRPVREESPPARGGGSKGGHRRSNSKY